MRNFTASGSNIKAKISGTLAADEVQLGWTMIYYISDLTWTNENYIQIGGNSNPGSVYCDSLIIIGL